MLTLAQIQAAAINPEVAREAHTQAEKRLGDALATRASHEQKAFALLAAFTTLALAMFTVFSALAGGPSHAIAPAFLVGGAVFTVGAVLSAIAFWPLTYGVVGSDPSAWLRHGVIDGPETALPAALAYETYFYRERIEASARANEAKTRLIRGSLGCGLAVPILLGLWLWMGRG